MKDEVEDFVKIEMTNDCSAFLCVSLYTFSYDDMIDFTLHSSFES
jgi:hypothetical protein